MTDAPGVEVSIVMPAYNEENNIEKTVRECLSLLDREGIAGELVVANDGSQDGTLDILRRLSGEFSNLKVVDLGENVGYGGALMRAIEASRGRFVLTMDSDGQFDVGDLPRLLSEIKKNGYACVTGYRFRKRDTLPRVAANWGYNLLVRLLCGVSFKDSQCAMKIYEGDVIRRLDLEARGFPFPTEALVKLHHYGYRVGEIPIHHRPRPAGESKVRFFRTVRMMFLFLLYVRFKLALHKNRILYRL